jgi:hypothetical protein
MDNVMEAITNAIDVAKRARDEAGRGEEGRYLSLAVTALEEADGWVRKANNLARPISSGYPSDAQLDEAIENGKKLAEDDAWMNAPMGSKNTTSA